MEQEKRRSFLIQEHLINSTRISDYEYSQNLVVELQFVDERINEFLEKMDKSLAVNLENPVEFLSDYAENAKLLTGLKH